VKLRAGLDFRRPQYRREVFIRFYTFHLRYASHPGGVYYALPALADAYGWDTEQRAWAAFLNGNTQNPVTTALLMAAGDHPRHADQVLGFWRTHYGQLGWDTDRRYHKARLDTAITGYLALTGAAGGQHAYWKTAAADGWAGVWRAATAIPTMGRLSAWSYLEYLRILGLDIPDADTLLLGDRDGSRSHRNGLCLVLGLDDWMWWDRNPGFDGRYPPDLLQQLERDGAALLAEARTRLPHHPHLGYLTLESALCTYKSWHRPNRRYPGVYNDLLYDRLRHAQRRFGDRFDVLWQARAAALPAHMRLECDLRDPGCVPAKQNWYLNTGEIVNMHHEWPCFANGFADRVAAGAYGLRTAR
jgi:hypothetical protein